MHILFLDDDVKRVQPIRDCDTITYVRTAAQFEHYMNGNPIPDVISFDCDLGTPAGSPEGIHLARWMIMKGLLPKVAVIHSFDEVKAHLMMLTLKRGGVDVYIREFNSRKPLFELSDGKARQYTTPNK
jgi:hypothetical protein